MLFCGLTVCKQLLMCFIPKQVLRATLLVLLLVVPIWPDGIDCCAHQVTIWNTGEDAYQPQVYGNCVTIERRIGKTASTWRVLDCNGKSVGNKKKHLIDPMLDHFSINAANPLAVMTQVGWGHQCIWSVR